MYSECSEWIFIFFFFQAEDGIRDYKVTGVQTCALPISPVVKVGNLEPVREFLHVRDVVDAYARLLVRGQPGETYNVASGQGIALHQLFFKLADLVGVRVIPEVDPDLLRRAGGPPPPRGAAQPPTRPPRPPADPP